MKTLRAALPIVLLCTAGATLAADTRPTIVGTSVMQFEADEYDGKQYRQTVSDAFVARVGSAQKWSMLQPALDFCDAKKDSATQVFASVSTQAEREELLAARTDPRELVFVDIACPRAYVQAAYFAADDGDAAKAVRHLERAQQLAPFWASPHTERGYLYNAAGDRQNALAAYRRALALAERYPASANMQAMALRGIGWTLIELGDHDGARAAYERSLQVEPGNATALKELGILDDLARRKGMRAETPAFSTAVPAPLAAGPAMTVDEARVVEFTRQLEARPFDAQAPAMRSWLIEWITQAPDITVVVCNSLGLVGEPESPFESELLVQGMFGIAAYLLEHPEGKDDATAQQRAGVLSALKAYGAILRTHPEARVPSLDAYLQHQEAGDFDAYLAPILVEKCSKSPGA